MSHDHHKLCHCCEHKAVAYCKVCKVVYCLDCKREWRDVPYKYYPRTYPCTYGTVGETSTSMLAEVFCNH